jgi:hypothetical protein
MQFHGRKIGAIVAASPDRFAHQFTRIRFSVHMAMESGCRRRDEQDACTFELWAALSLAKLYQSNNRGATPSRWRLAPQSSRRAVHRATRPGLWRQISVS